MSDAERAGPERPTGIALHLVPEPVWRAQAANPVYAAERLAAEGFIHTTFGEDEVLAVANRYYREDRRPYVVIDVDLDRLSAPVRFDEAGPMYPHVYGPMETAAVVRVRPVQRDKSRAFTGIDDAAEPPIP